MPPRAPVAGAAGLPPDRVLHLCFLARHPLLSQAMAAAEPVKYANEVKLFGKW